MIRRLVLFTLALLSAFALAGFQHRPAAAASTISFYYFGDDAERAAYDALIAGFNKKYPDVTIKPVFTTGEDEFQFGDSADAYRQRLTLDFAANKPPDVFVISYREYGVFAEKGGIEPVGPYLDNSTTLKAADYYPEALSAFTRDKVLQCFPQGNSATVVYYNKDLFDKAKVAYPKAGWTWDDFVAAAKALTNTTDPKNPQYGLGLNVDVNRLLPFIWQAGGEIVDNYTTPTKFTFNTPEVKAGVQFFSDLQQKYKVVPDETQAKATSTESRFLNGTMGMLLFSRRLVPSLRNVKFDWDVAALPTGKKAATLLYADGYCISKGSADKDTAWKLIEYASSAEGQTILSKAGRIVPSLKSVANSPAFLDPAAKPKNSQVFLDLIPGIRTTPALLAWADIEEQINMPLEEAFYGDGKVDDAVGEMGDKTAPFLTK